MERLNLCLLLGALLVAGGVTLVIVSDLSVPATNGGIAGVFLAGVGAYIILRAVDG